MYEVPKLKHFKIPVMINKLKIALPILNLLETAIFSQKFRILPPVSQFHMYLYYATFLQLFQSFLVEDSFYCKLAIPKFGF